MLKKKLVKQCEELFEKLNFANSTISNQKDTIEALKVEVLNLKEEIEKLNALIDAKAEIAIDEEKICEETNIQIDTKPYCYMKQSRIYQVCL